jgi:YD repeat-containing protein
VIVGKYTDAAGVQHGFRRDTRGRFTTIDVPGAPRNAVTGLNDRGQLVGFYENPDAAPSPPPTGRPPVGRVA